MRTALQTLLGLVILLSTVGSAEARSRYIDTEDEIMDLGVMPDELLELMKTEDESYDHVGFFYKKVAVLGADVWSWSGQLVFFRKRPDITFQGLSSLETTYYVEIPDELVERYGWSTPIEYRVPVGLLIALCVVELAIVARRKRRAKHVLVIGLVLVSIAGVLFLLGLTWQIAFPLVSGIVHIAIAQPFFQPASTAELSVDDEADPPFAVKPPPPRPSQPLLPPPPSFEKDPFRAPPQPPPIQVKRPPTAPATAPVVHDDNADKPKLLT